MSITRKAGAILATDGLGGLVRRGADKLVRTLTGRRRPEPDCADARQQADADAAEAARHREEYPRLVQKFRDEVRRRGLGEVEKYYWYHTVDLGDGLVTPGDYDYRDRLGEYPFPVDMRGMTALDVGSATGFFAFEFERRGAEVTSVDLPSMADWDMIWSDRDVMIPKLLANQGLSSVEERDRTHTHGPFEFCHRLLNSRVRRCPSRIYDLTPERLGRGQFDLIFLGDILGHLFSPLQALNVLAPLCRGEMIVSLGLVDLPDVALRYNGGEDSNTIGRDWFQPNWEAVRQMLRRVGFRKVEALGLSRVFIRRSGWRWLTRRMIRATK